MKAKTKKLWINILFSLGLTIVCTVISWLVSFADISYLPILTLILTTVAAAVFFVWYQKNIFVFPSTFAITAFVLLAFITICFFLTANPMTPVNSDSTGWQALGEIFSSIFYALFTFIMIVVTVIFPPAMFGILLLASFIAKKCFFRFAEKAPQNEADVLFADETEHLEDIPPAEIE